MHIFALGRYHKVSRCQVVRDPGHFGLLSSRSFLHRVVLYRTVPNLRSILYRTTTYYSTAFRIRYILFRIRTLGSVPLTNGSVWVPKFSVIFRMQKIYFFIF